MVIAAAARFHHKAAHRDHAGRPKYDAHQAALKIQSCWRGKVTRRALTKKIKPEKNRHKPWGFYTHSLALTSNNPNGLLSMENPSSTRRWVWLLLEEPSSSQGAQGLSLFIIFFIVLSIAGFCLETVPQIYRASPGGWEALEVACTVIFTIEYLGRLAVCEENSQTHLRFMLVPMNVFDLMAVLPFYVELILAALGAEDTPALRLFRLVRLVRVIRIFKLGRYATGMRLFGEALAGSTTALSVLVFLLGMGVVLFSSALFYVEKMSCPELDDLSIAEAKVYHGECADDFNRGWSPSLKSLCCTEESSPNDFPSAVSAFWWSLVTMTSVGYGEVYPRTTMGKFVGFVAMLAGMVLIALPVAIVGQKFQDVYDNHDLDEAKRRAAMRMKVLGEVWSLVPSSDVVPKMRKLQLKDQDLSNSVTDLCSFLEEVWEQREQLMRERKYEFERQEEVHGRVTKLLSDMETVLDSTRELADR